MATSTPDRYPLADKAVQRIGYGAITHTVVTEK